jgi:hypothetical protein
LVTWEVNALGELALTLYSLGPEVLRLLRDFDSRTGCDPAVLDQLRNRFGHAIPDDYFDFMQASNGGEGPVGEEGYVHLWAAEDLQRESRDYDPEGLVPHLLMFGTDLGGTVYAFDTRSTDKRILAVPLPVEEEYAELRGRSFKEFLEAEGRLEARD